MVTDRAAAVPAAAPTAIRILSTPDPCITDIRTATETAVITTAAAAGAIAAAVAVTPAAVVEMAAGVVVATNPTLHIDV